MLLCEGVGRLDDRLHPALGCYRLLVRLLIGLDEVMVLEPGGGALVEEEEPERAEQEAAEREQRHLEVDGHHHEAARVAEPLQARVLVVRDFDLGRRVEAHDGLDGQAEGERGHKERQRVVLPLGLLRRVQSLLALGAVSPEAEDEDDCERKRYQQFASRHEEIDRATYP